MIVGLPPPARPLNGARLRSVEWQGERWKIRRGDVLRLVTDVPEESVDGVVTDCPYSSGGAMRGDRTDASTTSKYMQSGSGNRGKVPDFLGDTRDQRSFAFWCSLWYSELLRAAVPGAVMFSFTD